jgi:hypothetical protein
VSVVADSVRVVKGEPVVALDAPGCADALAASRAAVVEAEIAQVRLVAHWCDLHSGTVATSRRGRVLPGRERSVRIGGDGSPRVREFAAGELGLLLDLTTTGARALMRDVLDLRHRHPRLWAAVEAGRVRFFQARHVVRATRAAGLSGAQAEVARFVRTGRSNEYGTTTIYARARAGDAIFFYAMCDRIAQILKLQGSLEVAGLTGQDGVHPADAADLEMDVLRSLAVGILAVPARALALLAWAERHQPDLPQEPDEREEPEEPARPVPVVDLRDVPAEAFLPPATLYVHVSAETFQRQTRGPVRVEDVGPVTVEQAVDLLRHCRVRVIPVVDLDDSPSVDGYEVTGRVREVVELRQPFEVFPWGTLSSRKADKDHITAYVPLGEGGPPGQTALHRPSRLEPHFRRLLAG